MATQLDLQEQEQLDALKAFWARWGNLVTGVLLVVFGSIAAWNGYQWWQRDQGFKASAMYDELERAAQAGDADRTSRVADDLRQRYPRTTYAQHGALLAARVQFDKGQADAARGSLRWAAEQGTEKELQAVAWLRLAALQAQAKQYDEALKSVDAAGMPGFEGLAADRRGDVLALQGRSADAVAAYRTALKALDERAEYRRLVDAKLTALGGAEAASAVATAAPAPPAPPSPPKAPTAPAPQAAASTAAPAAAAVPASGASR